MTSTLTGGRPRLRRIERSSLTDTVIQRLHDVIDSWDLTLGSKLPSERVLCAELGVGRSTIREALRALEALGVIELHQGRGAFVRASTLEEAASVPAFSDWPRSYTWKIQDIIEARLAVESRAAALAALERTDEDLERMRQYLDRFRRAASGADLSELVLADVGFHDAVAVCGNAIFASLLKSIAVQGMRSRHTSLARRERWASVIQRHENIYAAILANDPHAAAESMESHLLDFARELRIDLPMYRRWDAEKR